MIPAVNENLGPNLYACMYVRMLVCVCMYVLCTYACICVCNYVSMYGCMCFYVIVCMYVCIKLYMCVFMFYVYLHSCICVYHNLHCMLPVCFPSP